MLWWSDYINRLIYSILFDVVFTGQKVKNGVIFRGQEPENDEVTVRGQEVCVLVFGGHRVIVFLWRWSEWWWYAIFRSFVEMVMTDTMAELAQNRSFEALVEAVRTAKQRKAALQNTIQKWVMDRGIGTVATRNYMKWRKSKKKPKLAWNNLNFLTPLPFSGVYLPIFSAQLSSSM